MFAVRAPQSKPAMWPCEIAQSIHQGDYIDGKRRLLAVARRVGRKKAVVP